MYSHCGNCGESVDVHAKECPHCKSKFSYIMCPHCGFKGFIHEFSGGTKCPNCLYDPRIEENKDKKSKNRAKQILPSVDFALIGVLVATLTLFIIFFALY